MSECRQLLFQVKDKVFGKQYGIPKKSKALQKMFEREFKELTMDSVRKPKSVIIFFGLLIWLIVCIYCYKGYL